MAVRGKGRGAPTSAPQTGPKPKRRSKKDDAQGDLEADAGMQALAEEGKARDAAKAKDKPHAEGEPLNLDSKAGKGTLILNYRAWRKQKDLVDEADNARRSASRDLKELEKTFLAELGEGAVEQIKAIDACQTEEGAQKMIAKMEREARALRIAGKVMELDSVDRRPIDDRALEIGELHGMLGVPFRYVFGTGTTAAQNYEKGWNEGTRMSKPQAIQDEYKRSTGPTLVGPPTKSEPILRIELN